jgi:hypothetical protein
VAGKKVSRVAGPLGVIGLAAGVVTQLVLGAAPASPWASPVEMENVKHVWKESSVFRRHNSWIWGPGKAMWQCPLCFVSGE